MTETPGSGHRGGRATNECHVVTELKANLSVTIQQYRDCKATNILKSFQNKMPQTTTSWLVFHIFLFWKVDSIPAASPLELAFFWQI